MPNQKTPPAPPTISNLTGIFMVMLALVLDGIQGILTMTGFGALIAMPIGWFAEVFFYVWYVIIGAASIGGKGSGLKMLSVFGSAAVESVGFLDGLPGITAGVVGVIVSTRIEDKAKAIKPAANDNEVQPSKQRKAA